MFWTTLQFPGCHQNPGVCSSETYYVALLDRPKQVKNQSELAIKVTGLVISQSGTSIYLKTEVISGDDRRHHDVRQYDMTFDFRLFRATSSIEYYRLLYQVYDTGSCEWHYNVKYRNRPKQVNYQLELVS
eukprot:sb/3475155/